MGFHWKSWFWEGVHEKSIYRGELPEKEGGNTKASEVIQKQRDQSLNIQKHCSKGVLIKRCSEIGSKFTGEHLCRSVISKQLYWNHTSAWMFSCKFVAYFQNCFS